MSDDLKGLFAIADAAIAAGYDVLPAATWAKGDGTLAKAPLLARGHLDAHRDAKLIRRQLANPPHIPASVPDEAEVVVGFVPGSGGCGVLDCDVKRGKAGQESYEALTARHGAFVTAAWRTPSGGANVLWRKPLGAEYSNFSPWPGIDVRADGGWVVAPGNSVSCAGGGEWAWVGGSYDTPSPLPEAMTALLRAPSQSGHKATSAETVAFIEASPTTSTRSALDAFGAALETLRDARLGSRHDALVRVVAWAFGMEYLDLREAMEQIGVEWQRLTAGEGREDEVGEVARWVVGQEVAKRVDASSPPPPASPPVVAPQLDPVALHGILGDVVDAIRPHTEACDAALLVTLLVEVGNYIGRGPHLMVESDRHGCALFATLVGESARSRKGTAAGRVQAVMERVDALNIWRDSCIASGFGSGEGVIAALDNDERSDDRLLVEEREFAGLLTVASREGSVLSSVLRNGWDGQPLRSRVKKQTANLAATDYHLSALGHITKEEAGRLLTSTEQSNGFANRFLWVHAYRARLLPHGGDLREADLKEAAEKLKRAIEGAQKIDKRVTKTDAARRRWEEIYGTIAEAELPGIAAALTNRAEAQILRLALIYAVLGGSPQIDVEHLDAAWALWHYCEATVLYVWGDNTGDRDVDRLVDHLCQIAPEGLSANEIHETVFGKHKPGAPIAARAKRYGLIRSEKVVMDGRSREVFYAL